MIRESQSPDPETLIAQLCTQLEKQWEKNDPPPEILRVLENVPKEFKEECFRRLLIVDVAERNKRQLDTTFENYVEAFPAYRQILEDVLSEVDFRLSRTTAFPASDETCSVGDFDVATDVSTESIPSQIDRYAIQKKLGAGGYGTVYLARDTRLQRDVALKVLHASRALAPDDVENFVEEAQTVAALDHPGIVPIYDFPQVDDQYLVVSKYIEGETLTQRQYRSALSIAETVRLIMTLADTLGFVHDRRIVHRDVKPGNILLSSQGECFLTDFGLALRDTNFGLEPGQMGTVFYMSPEQARGEAHLVDASCDLFSLGIVMYELLTGSRPFSGTDWQRVMTLICSHEPVPPRQRVPAIPPELQRICLKMMQKRRVDRYASTAALIEDLKHFVASEPDLPDVVPAAAVSGIANSASGSISSGSRGSGIVPRGLRSFDRDDAVFFRELLPGPTDRGGIPDSLRFWKNRIETPEGGERFRVGVIYGPSGSGKSSFIKAGLIPLLDKRIAVAFTEAVPHQTSTRTLDRLRSFYPDLPADMDLAPSLAWVRQNRGGRSGRRLLIVVDQFEQWLHTWEGNDDDQMALALRQCDGEFLQAVLLVRDDFWMAVSKFADVVGVSLIPSENLGMVDLFDLRHARKVLIEYGRAHDRLPLDNEALTRSQAMFLDEAVGGLATGDKVIPVQLAAFSEIMKGRDWDRRSLRELGGVEGVGVRFLEEAFNSSRTPAANRIHQKAAQAVLRSLLPATDADIKGATRSRKELQELAGYADRSKMFDQLLKILDGDLRLITPVQTSEDSVLADDSRHYQLTHDFLVPAVREWIHRGQNQTRTGRALLRLADRTEIWKSRQDSANLPSWSEWAAIWLFTRRRQRTTDQQKLMNAANRRYGLLSAAIFILALTCGIVAKQWKDRTEGLMLVDQLTTASSDEVGSILDRLSEHDRWSDAPIRQLADENLADSRPGLRSRLYLLRRDSGNLPLLKVLSKEFSSISTEEFVLLRSELRENENWQQTAEDYWDVIDSTATDHEKLRAALMLSGDDDDPRWPKVSENTTQRLVQLVLEDSRSALDYFALLKPVARHVHDYLVSLFTNRKAPMGQRQVAMSCFVDLFQDDPTKLISGLLNVDSFQIPVLLKNYEIHRDAVQPLIRETASESPTSELSGPQQAQLSTRQANAASLRLLDGADESIWRLLRHSPMPGTRSKLIERMVQMRVPPSDVQQRLRSEKDPGILSALMLVLGTWQSDALPPQLLEDTIAVAQRHFREHPHAGVHSAAEWMLRRRELQDWIYAAATELSEQPVPEGQRWQILNELGMTLVAVDFRDGYTLQVSADEVTYEQYTTLLEDPATRGTSYPRHPMNLLGWHDAVEFCRALTEDLDLKETDQYFPPLSFDNEEQESKFRPAERRGVRLLNRWESLEAYLGQSQQRFAFGHDESLLPAYENTQYLTGAVEDCGSRKPTPEGFFGFMGNASEWGNLPRNVRDYKKRPIFGGGYESTVNHVLKMQRAGHHAKETRFHSVGIRVARLLQSAPSQNVSMSSPDTAE